MYELLIFRVSNILDILGLVDCLGFSLLSFIVLVNSITLLVFISGFIDFVILMRLILFRRNKQSLD